MLAAQMRTLSPIALLAVAALGGCAGSGGGSEQSLDRAITNGTDDPGDPAVVALVDDNGDAYCTGTLITPAAVLTAAHCLDGDPPARIFFGATPGVGGESVPVMQVRQHPAYDPTTHVNDLGVVVLAASPDVEPVQVYAAAFDPSYVGKSIRLVGFGSASTLDTTQPHKRTGNSRIAHFTNSGFTFAAAPSQTCFGDSGGPAFLNVNGADVLVGVTSTGDLDCIAGGTDARVDAVAVEFVKRFLTAADPAPSVVGGCSTAAGAAHHAPTAPPLVVALLLAALALRARRR